ncbi:molecular chaperone DnaK [Azospirillum fermentarium]|uniref:Hsp70 family protein n=1 Tax=Azospirillum fermentarium TaxID=1233114 RepID=UPI002226DD2C|nr:Hsp70 family protein [Azospirillum fermentarium]MCW2247743.1 molecular chaperone DnaK [Azospirillum fermentarium]
MGFYVGIDLGTTNSAIAGTTGGGDLRIFRSADGTDVLPSVLYVDKRGHRLYGQRAYQQAMLSPENVAAGFKRLMGTNTPIDLQGAGLSLTAEECSSDILKVLVGQAYTETGTSEVSGTVVTIPAAFNQMQSEATLRAARAAGLESVALLQEPVAAAMASISQSRTPGGQFLVYDLGGGTFDLALVQSLSGSVSILAHEGINMLGGRDFDRILVNNVVRPWLLEHFDLPDDFQANPKYRRIIRVAGLAVEKTKIALSAQERETIFASDDEVRVTDASGQDIHLDIPIDRTTYERLIADKLDETIALCHKILKDSGYRSDDIDRVVFIGGPSKTPAVRERVSRELGVPADLTVDPMTAVALGAAIYAESRDWNGGATSRKTTRSSTALGTALELRLDHPARVSANKARVRIKVSTPGVTGCVILIESQTGWSTERMPLSDGMSIDLRTDDMGVNTFRVTVFDRSGRPLPEASGTFEITRTHSSAAAIPATQTLAVKVLDSTAGDRNLLEVLIAKGTPLPASGSKAFRAARTIRAGDGGHIDLELFQQAPGVSAPELNLPVGVFRIASEDLAENAIIRTGDQIVFHWQMNDSGLLRATVELPSAGQTFDTPKYYVDQAGHRSFEGTDGARMAESALQNAQEELEKAQTVVGAGAVQTIDGLAGRLAEQRRSLTLADDADAKRAIAEEGRHIRQDIARLLDQPENRARLLEHELGEIKGLFNRVARDTVDFRTNERFDQLARTATQELARSTDKALESTEKILGELKRLTSQTLWQDPMFIVAQFRLIAEERHLAIDKELFGQQVRDGLAAIERDDMPTVRRIFFEIVENQVNLGSAVRGAGDLASIMRS